MASAISAARVALYNLLTTAAAHGSGTALADVQVSWGDPQAYEEQEVVALAGVTDPGADVDLMGGGRGQTFGIVVGIKVYGPEKDAQTVDTRGYALAAAVQDAVASDMTLAGSVLTAIPDGGRTTAPTERGASPVADAPGRIIFLNVTVSCMALGA